MVRTPRLGGSGAWCVYVVHQARHTSCSVIMRMKYALYGCQVLFMVEMFMCAVYAQYNGRVVAYTFQWIIRAETTHIFDTRAPTNTHTHTQVASKWASARLFANVWCRADCEYVVWFGSLFVWTGCSSHAVNTFCVTCGFAIYYYYYYYCDNNQSHFHALTEFHWNSVDYSFGAERRRYTYCLLHYVLFDVFFSPGKRYYCAGAPPHAVQHISDQQKLKNHTTRYELTIEIQLKLLNLMCPATRH